MAYRDRQGKIISQLEWGTLWEDPAYRVLVEEEVGDVLVRTFWEGIDNPPQEGPDTEFGTMFLTASCHNGGSWRDEYTEARTEEEAFAAHREVVQRLWERFGTR